MLSDARFRFCRIFSCKYLRKSDRNCLERAERTSVRISLMIPFYRSSIPMSSIISNEITFIQSEPSTITRTSDCTAPPDRCLQDQLSQVGIITIPVYGLLPI